MHSFRSLRLLAVTLFCLLAPLVGATAELIQFSAGPFGGAKVTTSWGTFIAFDNGGAIWVGTESEFLDWKMDSIARRDGLRPVKIESNDGRSYINAGLRLIKLGNGAAYDITTNILFGAKASPAIHRAKKPANSEYVSVLSVPSVNAPYDMRIVTTDGLRSYRPTSCDLDTGFINCEFVVPRTDLVVPVRYFFFAKNRAPAVLESASIAKQHFEDVQALQKTTNKGAPLGQEAANDIRSLHLLDSSIPETFQ